MRSSAIGALALLFMTAIAPLSLLCSSALGPSALLVLLALGRSAQAADWATYNGEDNATNFSPLKSIDKSNVAKMGLAWSMDLDEKGVIEGTPLAVNGVLYCAGDHSVVYAVDARSGLRLWKYDAEVWKHNPAKLRTGAGIDRGVGYADGRVFLGAQDGRLIALDAASGKEIWSVQTVPLDGRLTITGAPRTFNGKVIVGNAFSESGGVRGFVAAYDAATGRQVWRFYTVPGSPEENKDDPVMERAAKTWSGEFWKRGAGGSVWDAITFDHELNRIYVGTANANPWSPHLRGPAGEDNLFTASIVALDADTGKYIWHYQVNPSDAWDYDATNQIALADLTIDGKPRKVLMQAPKDGFFYVIDRTDGKLISAEKIGKVTWAERIDIATGRPVDAKNGRFESREILVWPSIAGIHNWQSLSYSPVDRLAYVPTLQMASRFMKADEEGGEGMGFKTAFVTDGPGDGKGTLLAWDPVRQKARWSVLQERAWNGGIMSTAGDLVFQGDPDGYLTGYDGSTGALLWRFYAGAGILGAPISYSVGNKQYVAVQTGDRASGAFNRHGAKVGWKYGAQPRRLLAFSLDGTALLPPTPLPDLTVHAVDDPAVQIDKADVEPGRKLYRKNCMGCHGLDLESDGAPAPDLRESQIALKRENIWNIVHDGALMRYGMPRFQGLTEAQVGQIYAYIRARARETLAESASR